MQIPPFISLCKLYGQISSICMHTNEECESKDEGFRV